MASAPPLPAAGASGPGTHSKVLIPLAMALFFAFGFCTVLINDTLTPKLKALFALSYTEVMLTPFAFFGAYFLVSLPAAALLARIGYLPTVVVGLILTAAGCTLFTPAAEMGVYGAFLGATFITASGVTIVQVAANPLATAVGDPRFSHSRLTLAQAFNSLATMVGPIFGSMLILANSKDLPDAATVSAEVLARLRFEEAEAVQGPFFGIAIALLILAGVCALFFRRAPKVMATPAGGYARLLRKPRLMLGALSIFAYVGAEVAIGSLLTNYLMSEHAISAPIAIAGSLVSVYWGGAMVGRFIGAFVLRRVDPGKVLMGCAIGAGLLCAISGLGTGMIAAVAILAIGLCNSIMFPTIFTLAVEGLGDDTPQGSGILCLAIVGGALVPLLSGAMADGLGLTSFLVVPVVCYIWIAAYGRITRRGAHPANQEDAPVVPA